MQLQGIGEFVLDNFYEKLRKINLEAEKLIDTQKELIVDLMLEYQEVARWYVDKNLNYTDVFSKGSDKIIVARDRNEGYGAYLWDPSGTVIEYYDGESYGEGRPIALEDLLGNRYFKEIVGNIKALDHLIEDDFNHENRIKNELQLEIEEFKQS